MAGINKAILIGNVGGDPEVRTLANGSKVVNLSLATSESYTDRSGQRQTQTEWHRIELWDSLASIAEQYVRKGDPLYIEGKIRYEKWTDQNGVEKNGVRIRGTNLQLLSSRGNTSDSNSYASESTPSSNNNYGGSSSATPPPQNAANSGEDDLPF